MPDINVDPDYPSHPKTIQLKALLGNDADIFPVRMWCWCAKYSKDEGSFGKLSSKEIAYYLGWFADPEPFILAMVKTRFLEKNGRGGYRCHGWRERNGHIGAMSAKGRANAIKRWDEIRKNGKVLKKSIESINATSIATKLSCNASSNALTYRTEPAVPAVKTTVTVDSRAKEGQTETALGAEQRRLLDMRWNIEGQYFTAHIINLPIDYCQWALKNIKALGVEYRAALKLRLEMFEQDSIKK